MERKSGPFVPLLRFKPAPQSSILKIQSTICEELCDLHRPGHGTEPLFPFSLRWPSYGDLHPHGCFIFTRHLNANLPISCWDRSPDARGSSLQLQRSRISAFFGAGWILKNGTWRNFVTSVEILMHELPQRMRFLESNTSFRATTH